jgi:hypothetical protein
MDHPTPRKKASKRGAKKQLPKAFLLFCRDERPEVLSRCPEMTASEVSSVLSHRWRSLSKESKDRYKREEQRLKAEYNKQNEDPIACFDRRQKRHQEQRHSISHIFLHP